MPSSRKGSSMASVASSSVINVCTFSTGQTRAKACRAAGIPLWSPHDLRHRRISLMHLRGIPWARIGEFVGQRDLTVTANTYTHVMLEEGEIDYANLLV